MDLLLIMYITLIVHNFFPKHKERRIMALPTFKEVWSRYLFDSDTVPTGDELLSESFIRNDLLVKI